MIFLKIPFKYLESHCIIIHSIKYQNNPCQNHITNIKPMLHFLKPVTRSFNTSWILSKTSKSLLISVKPNRSKTFSLITILTFWPVSKWLTVNQLCTSQLLCLMTIKLSKWWSYWFNMAPIPNTKIKTIKPSYFMVVEMVNCNLASSLSNKV